MGPVFMGYEALGLRMMNVHMCIQNV